MTDTYSLDRAFEIIRDCFRRGGKLLLCGNGGSAADCDHIAAELVNGMTKRTAGLPAFSLCSQAVVMTAIANDTNSLHLFSQQVSAYGMFGDVLLAISTSGESKNILTALEMARVCRMRTILLTRKEFELSVLCRPDVAIKSIGSSTAEIQEQHIKVYHELCRRLEEEFYP